MKGKVENTIPERQFENIRTTYYFDSEEERILCIERSIQDCIQYKDIVSKLLASPDATECLIGDIKWRKNHLGKWTYEKQTKEAKVS
jgi:hypothetical protein